MKTTTITRCVVIIALMTTSVAFAQSRLIRRLNQSHRSHFATHDSSSVLYSSDEERAEYFGGEYTGKWKFGIGNDAVFDTNVFKDPASLNDWHWDYSLDVEYEWWVSKESGLQITPLFGLGGSRFNRYQDADVNSLLAGLKVSVLDKLPVDVALEYAGGWDFDGQFRNQVFTAHDLAFTIGKGYKLGTKGVQLEWGLGGGYLFTQPSDFESPHVDATLALTVPITERLEFGLSAGESYSDYVNSAPAGRGQWLTKVGAELSYGFGGNKDAEDHHWGRDHALTLGVQYTTANDTDPAADFDQVLVTVGVKLAWEKLGFRNLFK